MSNELNIHEVEELFLIYCGASSQVEMATLSGHSRTTINRYIHLGDLKRGIEPFQVRFNRLPQKSKEKFFTDRALSSLLCSVIRGTGIKINI